MKAQFIDRLISTPWHIGTARGRTIISHMLSALLKSERPAEDIAGDPLPKMQIVGDVAFIPINGVLMLNVPDWIKSYGFNLTDPNDIEQEFDVAMRNPSVTSIMLTIDSPGGESSAGEKIYDLTAAAMRRKNVGAYTQDGGYMCSAAYHSAAPAAAIYAGKYAEVGCIGTYMAYLDDSAYWESQGLKWETFRSGDFKGIDGELSPDQREYFQRMVDECGTRFRSHVIKHRTEIDPADMQGQVFRGDDAASRGFLAGTVKDVTTAVAKLRAL